MITTILLSQGKEPPPEVTDQIDMMIGWLVWAVTLAGMFWLAKIGVTMWQNYQAGTDLPDAAAAVIWNLLAAVLLTTSAAIASAVLTF